MTKEQERCIALAGLFQATAQVVKVANTGMTDSAVFETSIHSLFQTDPDSTRAVYGELAGVAPGLRIIRDEIGGTKPHNTDISRYAISLLHLDKQVRKNRVMLNQIGEGIELARQRLEHYPMGHANILAQLAEIYADTVSTLKPRIMVKGEPLHLQNSDNVNRIRALLLAGIRSAILWRQLGGNRFQILVGRKRLVQLSDELLQGID